LLSCKPAGAPGYDGFNIKCIKHVWSVIGDEFSSYVLQFFESGNLPKAINTTWVTLTPKKKGAVDILDFRPISMVGCIYKVIAKILSRRSKEVMPGLIGPTQIAFVSGRQILDGALIANELVNWLRNIKKKGSFLSLIFGRHMILLIWTAWILCCLRINGDCG